MTDSRWAIAYQTRAQRDLRRLDPPVGGRVVRAIERVATNPAAAPGLERLTGRPELRLRVGDWRVLIELDHSRRQITVRRILPRGRAYDR